MKKTMIGVAILAAGCAMLAILLAGIVLAGPDLAQQPSPPPATYAVKKGDQQLAYLLVKLELKTRAVMKGHYERAQSGVPGINFLWQRWLARNAILPAAVADPVFSGVVPGATGGRAWVKMVVDEPRNEHNKGDAVALELLRELKGGKTDVERDLPEAYYYGEPIKTSKMCLTCHGEPKGAPDPVFPKYKKDGWKDAQVIGGVIARVAPEPR